MFLWGFPCGEEVSTAVHLLPWNPLAICMTAPLHSFLLCMWPDCDNSLEQPFPTLPSACWSQPRMQIRAFPNPPVFPCSHTRTALNTQVFSGFHFETVQLLPTPELHRRHCSSTQFLAPVLFQSVSVAMTICQDDLGDSSWF